MARGRTPLTYTIEKKLRAIERYKAATAEGTSQTQYCMAIRVKRSTFQSWLYGESVFRAVVECTSTDKRRGGRAKHRTVGGSGRVSKSQPIEDQLLVHIKDMRRDEIVVTRQLIIDQAKAWLPDLLVEASEEACNMWCARFMQRNRLTIRRVTHSRRIARQDLEIKRVNFVDTVADALLKTALDYDLRVCQRRSLFNMDQTAIYTNDGAHTTVEFVGAAMVPAIAGASDNVRCTAALTVCADGLMPPPHFVFKGTPGNLVEDEVSEFVDPTKASFSIQKNAWFDETVMLEYIDKVWKYVVSEPSVIILDSLKVHKMESVMSALVDLGTAVVFVPGGATGVAQPLDVGVMSPFKRHVRQIFFTRHRGKRPPRTAATKRKDMYERAMESIRLITRETVINSFNKAGHFFPEGPSFGSDN